MFFFDYIYYVSCNYYRRFKDERNLDSWRSSGIVTVGGTLSLLSIFVQIMFIKLTGLDQSMTNINILYYITGIFAFFAFSFSIIRYNKFTDYKEIHFKLEKVSKQKILIYNILTAFVGTFIAAVMVGPLNK